MPTRYSAGGTYHATGGATYAHGTTGYSASAAHVALPTDAGYGMSAGRTGTAAFAGYHQTAAVSGGLDAARGTAVQDRLATPASMVRVGIRPTPAPGRRQAGRPGGHGPRPPGRRSERRWVGAACSPLPTTTARNITYQDNQVYYGNQAVATAGEYYQQAAALARVPRAGPQSATGSPWASSPWSRKSSPTRTTSCSWPSTNRGALRGNYSDLLSGTNLPIQGSVDKKTQRVAWTIGNNKTTVGETGLYNLTQDEAPVLIHIGKDKTQQWLLVRLKQPEPSGDAK